MKWKGLKAIGVFWAIGIALAFIISIVYILYIFYFALGESRMHLERSRLIVSAEFLQAFLAINILYTLYKIDAVDYAEMGGLKRPLLQRLVIANALVFVISVCEGILKVYLSTPLGVSVKSTAFSVNIALFVNLMFNSIWPLAFLLFSVLVWRRAQKTQNRT